ncbi:MAG TPA: hypothetical protein DCS93_02925 [Microscillaceae bacterium]|nr:hypothetical protein [Microscillaceae bacterium]
MINKLYYTRIFLLLVFSFTCCQFISKPQKQVEGIIIPDEFFEFSKESNYYLVKYIKGVLAEKPQSLKNLIQFDCGGASFCYDLGGVALQTLDKIGEEKMVELLAKLDKKTKKRLELLLLYGLEYSDINSKKRKAPRKADLALEFPRLHKSLTQ